MAHLVRSAGITSDSWQLLETAEAVAAAVDDPAVKDVLLPLALWLKRGDAFAGEQRRLGVLLEPTDDPQTVAEHLPEIHLVAVKFARFSDGRGYSIARLLRGRYRYAGELRAIGDVLLDQLFYLKRVGFDAFALRDDQDPRAAAAALRTFSDPYQGSSDAPPLFRRRALA